MQSHNKSDQTIHNSSRSKCIINLFETILNDGKEPFQRFFAFWPGKFQDRHFGFSSGGTKIAESVRRREFAWAKIETLKVN